MSAWPSKTWLVSQPDWQKPAPCPFCGQPLRAFYSACGWTPVDAAQILYGERTNPKLKTDNLVMMLFLPWDTWVRLLGWLAIGLIVYFSYGRFHSRLRSPVGKAPQSRAAASH